MILFEISTYYLAMSTTKSYFGITPDFKCHFLGNSDYMEIKSYKGSEEYLYLLERYENRKSQSGATSYFGTRINSNNLNVISKIKYEGCEIEDITGEYWWSLNCFNENENITFSLPFDFYYDKNLCMVDYKLRWAIFGESYCGKVCFVKFKDSLGHAKYVRTSIEDDDDIERLLNQLKLFAHFKIYSAFKLFWLISQFMDVKDSLSEPDERVKAKNYVNEVITPEYKHCKQFFPNTFRDFPFLEENYSKCISEIS